MMNRLRQIGFTLLVFWALPMEPLSAWEQVVTFDEFEVGTFGEPDAAIGQVVRVVHDEGFEEETAEGFARHQLAEDGTGGLMYSLSTGGYGWSWGHVFAAIPLDRAIEERGTLYFQFAMEGSGGDSLSFGLSPQLPDPVGTAGNPWGWADMGHWSGFATHLVNSRGRIGVRIGRSPDVSDLDWMPGVWYEIWMTVDVTAESYSVYLRAPEAGIPEQRVLSIGFYGLSEYMDVFFFRMSAETLRSFYLGMAAGYPDDPNVDHRWWINNVAVDFEEGNLSDPPVPAPGPPPPVDHRIFGFHLLEGTGIDDRRANADGMLGPDVWFAYAPYVYSFVLERWMFIGDLIDRDPARTNFAAWRGAWVYIWDSPFAESGLRFSEAFGTWVYAAEGGWAFVWNSR